jgi:type I restriction enzyme S subunit
MIFVTKGTPGRVCWVPDPIDFCIAQDMVSIRPNPMKVYPKYLLALLRSPSIQKEIENMHVGSLIPHFKKGDFDKLFLPIPNDFDFQKKVGDIYFEMSLKIELNRRMNETLEGIAQAVWGEWFGKYANGEQELPAGWRWGVLEDAIGELETGGRPKGGVKNILSGVPSIGAESITKIGEFDYSKTKYVPEEYFDLMKKGIIKHRDILIYKDGGKPGNFIPHISMFGYGFPFEQCAINEHVYRFQAKQAHLQNYMYLWLNSDNCVEEMKLRGTGVAIPGLNSTELKALEVLLPDKRTLESFDQIIDPLFTMILRNSLQSRTLASLRDTLLPRLMRGEVLS